MHQPSSPLATASRRRGFTFVDLVVAMCLVVVISGAIVSAAGETRAARDRQKCAANLRMIGQAIMLYANENNGLHPRTVFDVKTADKPTAFTGSGAAQPFKADGPKANDVTAAMFLLMREEDLPAPAFVCPATGKAVWDFGEGKKATLASNWPSDKYLSYSYRNPYPSMAAIETGYKATVSAVDATIAVAADGNPGGDDLTRVTAMSPEAELAKVNSYNHGRAGQNVLFGDGAVRWVTTPFAGPKKDNIYTFGASGDDKGGEGVVGSPANANDSVLLPVLGEGKP